RRRARTERLRPVHERERREGARDGPTAGREDEQMTQDEEMAATAAKNFYNAIESMVRGEGLEPMRAAWHHTKRVTGGHPSGEWAEGWDEIWATWEVFSSFGRADRGGSKVRSIKA